MRVSHIKGQAISLHIVVTAIKQMKTKENHNNNNEFHSGTLVTKNVTKMNNDGKIQPLSLIMVERILLPLT